MQKKSKRPSDIETLLKLPVKVDLLVLKDLFAKHYKNPTKKIFEIKEKGYLVPIKRGQYFNLKSADFKELQVEPLANSLYFPSYVSAEWALQYYGLLTEGVRVVTSVTPRRSKEFKTPVGIFSFEHISKKRYPHGYSLQSFGDVEFFLASVEKALLDYINLRIGSVSWKTKNDIEEFLVEDVRIDTAELLKMAKVENLEGLMPLYHRNSKEARVIKWLLAKKQGK